MRHLIIKIQKGEKFEKVKDEEIYSMQIITKIKLIDMLLSEKINFKIRGINVR